MRNLKEIGNGIIGDKKFPAIIRNSFEMGTNMDDSSQESILIEYVGNDDLDNWDPKLIMEEIVTDTYLEMIRSRYEQGTLSTERIERNGFLKMGAREIGSFVMGQVSDLAIYITAIIALD